MWRALVWPTSFLALLGVFAFPQWLSWRSNQPQAQTPALASGDVLAAGWSSGGTLHDVRVAEWLAGSDTNQLGTAADWALAFPSVRVAVRATGRPDGLLPYARAMRGCVSEAAADEAGSAPAPRTADIAVACAVLLKWVTPET